MKLHLITSIIGLLTIFVFLTAYINPSTDQNTFTKRADKTAVLVPIVSSARAETCVSMFTVKNGTWNDISVWSCGRIPTSDDFVSIKHIITFPLSYTAFARKVSFDSQKKLTFSAGSKLITAQTGQPTDNDLLAYFSFDQNVCRNDGGSESSGTLKNDASFTNGKKGRCLQLDGFGDYVDLGRGYKLSTEFTVMSWINPDDILRSDAAIFAKYETNGYGPYDFYISYGRSATWISTGSGSYQGDISNAVVKANEWTHLAWVGSNRKVKFYINGVLDKEVTIPAMTTNNDLVTIGRQAFLFTTNGNLEFKGKIDEVRIYKRALATTEIQQFYLAENL